MICYGSPKPQKNSSKRADKEFFYEICNKFTQKLEGLTKLKNKFFHKCAFDISLQIFPKWHSRTFYLCYYSFLL
jgi:hypothetical protein